MASSSLDAPIRLLADELNATLFPSSLTLAQELRQELDNKISSKTAEMHELIPKIRDNWAKEKENAQ